MDDQSNELFELPIPEAERLSGLGGIRVDLMETEKFCEYLLKLADDQNIDAVVQRAVSTAAVIRYARALGSGIRGSVSGIFDTASQSDKAAHSYFIALRDKHIAHSVNDLEENQVVVSVWPHFSSAQEIEVIRTQHARSAAISFSDVDRLRKLAIFARSKIDELIEEEKKKLLPIIRALSLTEIRSFGIPTLLKGGDPKKIAKRRKTP